MDDLERRALKRDKGFLIRLGLMLGIGVLVAILVYGKLTSTELAGCAAQGFEDAAAPEGADAPTP